MLVQWQEDGGEFRFGELDLPTLPTPGQQIIFDNHKDETGAPIVFTVSTATWISEDGIVEGAIKLTS